MISENENPYNLSESLAKRLRQFKRLSNNQTRFQAIMELGKKLKDFPPELKTEENQVQGCASLTYIIGELVDGKMSYRGESNSHIVRGLLCLLIEGFNGLSPEEVLKVDPEFIEEMGLNQTLTASRANGFINTYHMMKKIATRFTEAAQSTD